MTDRTYLEINVEALRHNVDVAKKCVGKDVKIMCLVKSNAYGHGALEVAKYCKDLGDYFGVATIDEGIALRKSGIDTPILIVGSTSKSRYWEAIEYDIQLTVHSLESANSLIEFCKSKGVIAKVHIAVDTGMGRIGFLTDEMEKAVQICKCQYLDIKGIFTHLAKADELNKTYTNMQKSLFDKFVTGMQNDGLDVGLRHVSNSADILSMQSSSYDMVRMGLMTYGLSPSSQVKSNDLIPAMSWYSHIVQIKTLPRGKKVSYGGEYITQCDTVVATVSVGYGDGYPRGLSNKGYMLVNGSKAPIIGRICMDQTMIDVTHIDNVNVGDKVTLMGCEGQSEITADDIATLTGTINYEIVCGISQRVERVYVIK